MNKLILLLLSFAIANTALAAQVTKESWTFGEGIDGMSDEKIVYFSGTEIAPFHVTHRDYFYLTAYIWVARGCTRKSEEVYIVFSKKINIYSRNAKVKWDTVLTNEIVLEDLRKDNLKFAEDEKAIQNMILSKEMRFQLATADGYYATFKFPLANFKHYHSQLASKCG